MNTPPAKRRHFIAQPNTKHISKHEDESSVIRCYLAFLNIGINRKYHIAVGGGSPLCELKIKDT